MQGHDMHEAGPAHVSYRVPARLTIGDNASAATGHLGAGRVLDDALHRMFVLAWWVAVARLAWGVRGR